MLNKKIKGFLADIVPLVAIVIVFQILKTIVISISSKIDVFDPNDFQALLFTNPEKAAALLKQVVSVYVTIGIGFLLILVAAFFLYAYSRNYLWKTPKPKKWLSLPFILLLLGIPYLIITALLRYAISNAALMLESQNALNFVNNLSFLFFLLIYLYFIILYHKEFSKHKKGWAAISATFDNIKKHWTKHYKLYLKLLLIGLVLNYLLLVPPKLIPSYLFIAPYVNVIVLLGFVAWMRTEITSS